MSLFIDENTNEDTKKLNKTVEADVKIFIRNKKRQNNPDPMTSEQSTKLTMKTRNSNNNDSNKQGTSSIIDIPKIVISKESLKNNSPKCKIKVNTSNSKLKKTNEKKENKAKEKSKFTTSTPKSTNKEKGDETSVSVAESKDPPIPEPKVKPIKLIRNANNRKSLSIKPDSDTESIGRDNADETNKADKTQASTNTAKANGNVSASSKSKNSVSTKTTDENTNKDALARRITDTVIPIPGFPKISNIRSLSRSSPSPVTLSPSSPNTSNNSPSRNVVSDKNPPLTSGVSLDNSSSNKKSVTDKNATTSVVGRVGVRSFARIRSPPVEDSPILNTEGLEIEIKGEPLDQEEASRESEKLELLNNINLRPVKPANQLREIRINKVVPMNSKSNVKVVKPPESTARAKKSFPQSKKADEVSLNNKNTMVYIPIQPATESPSRPPQPPQPPPSRAAVSTVSQSVPLPRLPNPVSIASRKFFYNNT